MNLGHPKINSSPMPFRPATERSLRNETGARPRKRPAPRFRPKSPKLLYFPLPSIGRANTPLDRLIPSVTEPKQGEEDEREHEQPDSVTNPLPEGLGQVEVHQEQNDYRDAGDETQQEPPPRPVDDLRQD